MLLVYLFACFSVWVCEPGGVTVRVRPLVQMICEKPTVINDYEGGRAIPSGAIIAKLERALGARLPRGRK